MVYHEPVLLKDCIAGLKIDSTGTYVDVTFGGGGHSREILSRLTTGKLIAFDQDADAVKKRFQDALQGASEEELRYGHTLIGPHRDDFQFILDDYDAKATFSQGQHRLAILALKLSETALYKQISGEYPILLLDDVFSELDEMRGEALIEQIINMDIEQVFITAAKKEGIPSQKAGRSLYWIKEGAITEGYE